MRRFASLRRFALPGLSRSVLLAVLPLALAACGGDATEVNVNVGAGEAVRVETVTLTPTAFDDVLEVSGTVQGINDALLSAQAPGTVTYLAPLGATIGAGGAVAQIDPGLQRAVLGSADANVRAAAAGVERAQAAIDQAQAQLRLAEDLYGRQNRLYRDSIISALEFQQVVTQRATAQAGVAQAQAGLSAARAQLVQAQAGSQQARTSLAQTTVTAPFSGRVEERLVERGEQVTPGRQVVRLVATGRVKVRAGVPERYAGTLRVGDGVDVAVPTADGVRTGRVIFVGGAVDPASRTFPVEVEVGNAENDLKPAMAARLRIRRARTEGALVVPRTAVTSGPDGRQVWVVVRSDSGLVAQPRPVTLGSANTEYVVLASGVNTGDQVIVQGQTDVTTGRKVAVAAQQEPYRAPTAAPADSTRTAVTPSTDTAATPTRGRVAPATR